MSEIQQTFLYVLEHSIPDIFYIDITGREEEDPADILYEHGYREDQCSWLIMHERKTRIRKDEC